jgi:hypothetical protein
MNKICQQVAIQRSPIWEEKPTRLRRLQIWLQEVGSQLASSSGEPEIKRHRYASGVVRWQVRHPKTGDRMFFASEEEVRFWLEEQRF